MKTINPETREAIAEAINERNAWQAHIPVTADSVLIDRILSILPQQTEAVGDSEIIAEAVRRYPAFEHPGKYDWERYTAFVECAIWLRAKLSGGDAAQTSPETGWRVKTLNWHYGFDSIAYSIFGLYTVSKHGVKFNVYLADKTLSVNHDTLNLAQQAAQSDFEKRIWGALEKNETQPNK